jgi:hypothetical protein
VSLRGTGRLAVEGSRVAVGCSKNGNWDVGGSQYSAGLTRFESGFSRPVSQKLVGQRKVCSLPEQMMRRYGAWMIGGSVPNWIWLIRISLNESSIRS